MELEILENGEVFLPVALRRRLGINIGDTLQVKVKDGDIVLTPKQNLESEILDHKSDAILV